MCGRYTLIRLSDFTDMFPWIRGPEQSPSPRYNIAPTQPIAAVANDEPYRIDFFHWGLIPSWAKDAGIGNRMINARAETLAEKPAYRTALKRRRCVIPASGFYEWQRHADGKPSTAMYIVRSDERPLSLAGLWETWHSPDGSVIRSCTIITVPPNQLMSGIHNRMPAILEDQMVKPWLTPGERSADELIPLLAPFHDGGLKAWNVGRAVNNPRNDDPSCVAPAVDSANSPVKRKRQRLDDGGTLFDHHDR